MTHNTQLLFNSDPSRQSELYKDCVKGDESLRVRARQLARGFYLSAASCLKQPKSDKFLRCLGGHYVFDDQVEDFSKVIAKLRNIGEFISTSHLLRMLRDREQLDGRYFHLSFDDGLASVYRNALPVLFQADITSTLFVNSAVISARSGPERDQWVVATNYAKPLSVMTWEQLRAVVSAGHEIGAHTRTHTRLTKISNDGGKIESEVLGCKRDLEGELEVPCRVFAWPYGTHDAINAASMNVIKSAGFEAAFSLERGSIVPGSTPNLYLPRHHFEPQWPWSHIKYFAAGGMEHDILPRWNNLV